MTFMVTYQVQADPQGKGRPKFTRQGRAYTPAKTVAYETLIAKAAQEAMGASEPLETPVAVFVYISMPIPKSYPKKRREACLDGFERPLKTPDCDNVAKAFLDAMNGIVYKDDCQVVSLHVTKVYSEVGMVEVLVKEELI
jgi:Holliday junction resolvase RusA-like endonuclease